MSIPQYKDGKYIASWDFECPLCFALWNNESDPIGEGEEAEEDCPKCGAELIITASYSVDYDVNVRLAAPSIPSKPTGEDK